MDLDKVPHFPIALLSRVRGQDVCVIGWLNHDEMINGLMATHVPVGMELELDGRFGPSLETEVVISELSKNKALAKFVTRAMSGAAELHLTWKALAELDGGPQKTTSMMTALMGVLLGVLLSALLYILSKNNQLIKSKVELATKELQESQNRMRTILDNVPSIVLLKDYEGRHMVVNSFYEKARGVKAEDILGKKDSEVLAPELAKKIMERDREIMTSEQVQTYQEEVHHLDGSIHQYMMTKVPFLITRMKWWVCVAWVQIFLNCKKLKLKLKKMKNVSVRLTNNVQGVIYRCKVDPRYSMLFLNPYFQELTGYSVEDCLGEASAVSYNDIIHPEDRDRVWSEVQEALKENESYSLTYRIIHKDGQTVTFLSKVMLVLKV